MPFQHNQPGSQVPWQPGPAFPSPSVAPAGGSSEQLVQGQAAPIPLQVLLAAERAELGTPLKEYNRGAANSRFLTAIGGVGGLIGVISMVVGLAAVIGSMIILPLLLAAEPLPAKIFTTGFGLVIALLLVFFLRLMLRGISGGVFRAWGCPDGLIYKRGRRMHAIRWEQLGLVYHKIATVNGYERITGYAVQPINAPPFTFSTLGGKLAGAANAALPGRLTTNAGSVTKNGDEVSLWGDANTSAYEGLGELIEEHLVAYQLPLVRDLYRSGQTVVFGKLLIHQRGLSDGTNVVSWEEFHHAAIHDPGSILVYKKNGGTLAFQVTDLPNVALLQSFLGEIRPSQRHGSPGQQADLPQRFSFPANAIDDPELIALIKVEMAERLQLRKELLRSGSEGTATILRVNETGRTLSSLVCYMVDVQVSPISLISGSSSFQCPVEVWLDPNKGALAPGDAVRVRYDPQDTSRITIQFPWE